MGLFGQNKILTRFFYWIYAWLSLIDSIITIITLGFYWSHFSEKFMLWEVGKEVEYYKTHKENK